MVKKTGLGKGMAALLSDADEEATAAAGHGPPVDSRRYGPVSRDRLVARAWLRYGPPSRIGRLDTAVRPPVVPLAADPAERP